MIEIKKVLSIRAISFIIVGTFLFTNSVYSSPLQSTSTLRPPLATSRTAEEAIDGIKKAEGDTDSSKLASNATLSGVEKALQEDRYDDAYDLIMAGLLKKVYVVDIERGFKVLETLIAYYEADTDKAEKLNEIFEREKKNLELIQARRVRDFHIHSTFSDGFQTPKELVEDAFKRGVAQLALTDHDTIGGLGEARETAQQLGMDFVAGIELTTDFHGKTAHILGYGFEIEAALNNSQFMKYLEDKRKSVVEWAWEMCDKSQEDPVVITTKDGKTHKIFVTRAEINEVARNTTPSTIHHALIMARKFGAISEELKIPPRYLHYIFFRRPEPGRENESYSQETIEEYRPLLEKYKIDIKGYWRADLPSELVLNTEDAIKIILEIGGIAVLAHPGEHYLMEDDIKEMARIGITGLEVYTPKHKDDKIAYYKKAAKKYDLSMTCGTDFHDIYQRPKIVVGRDELGNVYVEGASIDDIKEAILSIRKGSTEL